MGFWLVMYNKIGQYSVVFNFSICICAYKYISPNVVLHLAKQQRNLPIIGFAATL